MAVRRRFFILVGLTCFAILGLAWVGPIVMLVCNQPSRAEFRQRDELYKDLTERFPKARIFLGPPYGPPHRWSMTFVIVGVERADDQAEIKDWLTQYKAAKDIRCDLKLKFYERHDPKIERAVGMIPAVDWKDVEGLLAEHDL